jgi:hypothetical protein
MARHLDREVVLLRRLAMGGTALEDLYSKPLPFELDEGLALARDRIMADCVWSPVQGRSNSLEVYVTK